MLKLEYALNSEDHVTFQLYTASKSKRIKKKRKKTKYRLPLIYLVLALIVFFAGKISLSMAFVLIGILWYFFYPKYEKKHFEKHYSSLVEENFKSDIDPKITIELTETIINTSDQNGNSSIKIEAIKEIDELGEYFFIRLKLGTVLILPKSKIENIKEFEDWLNLIIEKYGIIKNVDLDWKWK